MIRFAKYLTAAACMMVLAPSLASAQMASSAGDGGKTAPNVAAAMSLSDAKDLLQRWRRYVWSDLSPDMTLQAVDEFGPVQITEYDFPRDGVPSKYTMCPYEKFEPFLSSETTVNGSGAHKGEAMFLVSSASENGDDCFVLTVGVPTHDTAVQVASAMLRWKNSTLAEREALPAQEQQAFAPIVAAYQAANPRPEISEDVRRFRVIAETALQEKRMSDAVDAYEDGLKLAPWWPEGHFNAALALGELHYYDEAIDHMRKFIALAPDAPDARAAQDKIYAWQSEQQALPR